ncbi:peptidase C12, ubiquitin carboxyl-terminal hydrolase [Pelagophyceae sp. CCMP2097]|nr:peptidase C12, ubiquitin carboxyl-terminal hydrolase [Pelagophyceae sp. CCMP2097]
MTWLPLESTPEVLNPYASKLGQCDGWSFVDVWGLDDDLLAFIPQPCLAMCLLFPSDKIAGPRRAQLREASAGGVGRHLFFVAQHDALGNACGTIAMLHALGNAQGSGFVLKEGLPLARFSAATAASTPSARGDALAASTELRALSDETAQAGQTAGAGTDDCGDQHFITFVHAADGVTYELDGRTLDAHGEAMVVSHGKTAGGLEFCKNVARVVRDDFMSRDAEAVNFNVTALVKTPSE